MKAKFGKVEYQGRDYRPDVKNQFPGLYRARVEYTLDPAKRGRVKVRIPSIHGIPGQTPTYLETMDLPWAEPCFLFAGPDMGQFVVPLAGSTVYVMFEAGDPNKPVYIGGLHGVHLSDGKHMGVVGNAPNPSQISGGKWVSSKQDEVPLDVFNGISSKTPDPARQVYFKSRKGATLLVDDTDGQEQLSIIDRIGQVFGFVSPVQKSYNNTGNQSFQRGLANARNKTQFSLSKLVNNKAVVFIRDVGQQILRFVTQKGAEKADFVSNAQSSGNNKQSGLNLQTANGKAIFFFQDSSSNNRASITLTENSIEFTIMNGGSVVASAVFNASGFTSSVPISQGSVTNADSLWFDGFDENFVGDDL